MDFSEILGTIILQGVIWFPSIFFGALFLISFIREPRQFRVALFFFAFLIWTIGMALIMSGHAQVALVLFLGLLLVFPVVSVVALLANTIVVVRRNGLSLASLLPGFLAVFIVLLYVSAFFALETFDAPLLIDYLFVLFLLEGLWFSFTYVSLFLYSCFYRALPRNRVYDYIIVHGAGLNGVEPTPLLAGRIDKAFELWEHQGKQGKILVSGGQGADEQISEAEAMCRYLANKKAVPAEAIIKEDKSTTTMENLQFSDTIMKERSGAEPYRAAVVTSDYHVFRCAEYAHKLGISADGVGSFTRGWYWPAAFTREFIAITKAHWWPYLVIAILWAVLLAISLKGIAW